MVYLFRKLVARFWETTNSAKFDGDRNAAFFIFPPLAAIYMQQRHFLQILKMQAVIVQSIQTGLVWVILPETSAGAYDERCDNELLFRFSI